MKLCDIFDVAADAFIEGLDSFESILAEAGDAAVWYFVIGPRHAQPKQPLLLDEYSVTSIGFRKLKFPLVRRIYPNLIANELASVQQMSAPSGLLFYMDYKYGSSLPEDGLPNERTVDAYTRKQTFFSRPPRLIR